MQLFKNSVQDYFINIILISQFIVNIFAIYIGY